LRLAVLSAKNVSHAPTEKFLDGKPKKNVAASDPKSNPAHVISGGGPAVSFFLFAVSLDADVIFSFRPTRLCTMIAWK